MPLYKVAFLCLTASHDQCQCQIQGHSLEMKKPNVHARFIFIVESAEVEAHGSSKIFHFPGNFTLANEEVA